MTMNTNEFKEGTIIGVIENFHFQSLHRRIEPLVLYLINPAATNAISVKVAAGNFHEIIDYIESTWHKIFPTKQLEYSFLENKLNLLYIGEKRIQNLFTIFAILSVFIACLGLFGLTVYTAENRRKEIGIRKVVGASVSGITLMLSRDFTKSVLWANIFAWPLAWYIMSEWLEYFAYRIDIGWLVFIFSGGVSIIIALATIVTQVIKASIANPVKSLRYE